MDAKQLAELLNGREYREEITADEEAQAKASGLVVVFGASDDLMEFRGAIHDELEAYNGTTAYLTESGLLENKCEDSDCPYFVGLKKSARTIKAVWHDNGEYSWTFETTISHHVFEVMEEGEKYGQGIVFELAILTL